MAIDIRLLGAPAPLEPSSPQQPAPPAQGKKSFWHELVSEVASLTGIDPGLALRVATQESGLNPSAVNSSSGAVGIMQLMPETAAALGVNPHDAVGNVLGGVRYLKEQLAHFGDQAKALAAYNWGPSHVAKAVERWGADWLNHAPAETQHYVASILSSSGNASGLRASLNPAEAPPAAPVSPSSPHHLDPAVAAQVSKIRSALSAYLLSEILG